MMQQMLVDAQYHADPHPGNVMVLRDGRLALIDFGAASRIDPLQQSAIREVMLGVAQRDADVLRQAVLQVATLRRDVDDEELERALSRFMTRHLAPGMVPSAAMFNDLLQLFFTFGINLPPELSTFFRALITLEGTLTTLSPGYPVIDRAEAIAGEWMRARLAPSTSRGARPRGAHPHGAAAAPPPSATRPDGQPDRARQLAGPCAACSPIRTTKRVVTKLVNRTVLALTGGVVGVIGAMLINVRGGPPFAGQTSLYEFFGYFALFCSVVLIMRVIVSVLHDGVN